MKRWVWLLALLMLLGAAARAEAPLCWPAYDEETGLWGYIAETGEWRIAPQFGQAEHFHEGCAIVDMNSDPDEGTYTLGIIDETGAFLLEPAYYVFDFCDTDTGPVYFVMGEAEDGAPMGWFNIPNRFFSGLHWDECFASVDTPYVMVYEGMLEGLADRATGELVLPLEYSYTGLYDWGIDDGFIVAQLEETGACELIELGVGPVALPEDVTIDYYPGVTEGLLPFEKDGLYGYMNTSGVIVLDAQYDLADGFDDGYAEVSLLDEPEKFVVIDRQGRIILRDVKENGCYGLIGDALYVNWDDDTWGLVNQDGTVRCRYAYPEGVFTEWLEEAAPDGPLWLRYDLGDEECLWGLLSREGAILVEPQWTLHMDNLSTDPMGWQAAGLDGKWGYLDAYGQPVLPFDYEAAAHFEGALARVRFSESEEGYINRAGEAVFGWTMAEDTE